MRSYNETVNAFLYGLLDITDKDYPVIFDAVNYSVKNGGKRIRPFLVLKFSELAGAEPFSKTALYFASALECIHTYSLIHDDLPCMDDDDLRRGKPTNHKVFGEATAVLAGDALLTGAFEATATNAAAGAEISALATAVLANAAGRYGMVGGQVMDMTGETKKLTLEELLRLHSLKTGALISAACVMGALAAGVPLQDPRMEKVISYAENIGLAFQIVDDILDKTGNEADLGKHTGVDSEREKNTFLSFYSVEEAQFYADRLTSAAVDAIRAFPGSEALCALAAWLAERKK